MAELVDAYGRPVDKSVLKEPQAAPTFTGLRNIYTATHPAVGLTPERLSAIMIQAEFGDPFLFLELAQDIEERYPHYNAVLGTRKQAAASQEIQIEPASKDPYDKKIADWVRGLIFDDSGLTLESAIVDILDALGKGFSATEIVWDTFKIAGRLVWVPTQLKWRDPRWFMFDWISGEQILVRRWKNEQSIDTTTSSELQDQRRRSLLLMEQSADGAYIGVQPATEPLEPYKFITHIAKAKSGLPIRGGLTRSLAWVALFWNYTMKDWVTYAERFGIPARLGKYPTGANDADKAALLNACARIGSDATAIIPEVMNIEFLIAKGGGGTRQQAVFQDLTRYIDDLASKMVLGQTLTTDTPKGGGGTRAQGRVHDRVRHDIMAWDTKRLSQVLSRDLVRPIVDLNLGPQRRYPSIIIGVPEDIDSKIFVDSVVELVDRGLDIGQQTVRERVGIAAPVDGDKLLHPKQAAPKSKLDGDGAPPERSAHAIDDDDDFIEPVPSLAVNDDRRRVARVVVQRDDGVVYLYSNPDDTAALCMFPGGGVAEGETFRAAAVREVQEELGLDVQLVRWLADYADEHAYRRYYLAKVIGGRVRLMDADGSGRVRVQMRSLQSAEHHLTSPYDRAALAQVRGLRRQTAQVSLESIVSAQSYDEALDMLNAGDDA